MPQPALEINIDAPVLKIPGLETKFDTSVISNSLVLLLGDYLEARIVQQLHYWMLNKYGTVLKGLRWIYKPIRELLSEVLIGFTSWQIRMALASLVEKGLLLREHLFKEHHGHNFAPKNRTYYYSLNYEKLQEYIENYQNAETPENIRFVSDTKQFGDSSANPFCEKPQNKTDTTSIENDSTEKSLPTLPQESGRKKPLNQREEESLPIQIETVLARPVKQQINSTESEDIEKETSSAAKKEIVKENNLYKSVTKPKPKVQKTKPGTKPKRKSKAPWKDQEELKRFRQELIVTLPTIANARSPEGLAYIIIAQLRNGESHSYWDDFKAGLPIGSSLQKEWEIKPGVPYPMFLEYLAEKLKGGYDAVEQAYQAALKILEQPQQAQVFWSQFKRSVINVSEQVERDRALGVSNPNTPVWTRERVEPSTEEAATAGAKIMGVNNATQAAIEASRNPQLAAGNNPQLEGRSERVSSEQTEESLTPTPHTPHPVTTPDPWSDEPQTESQIELQTESQTESQIESQTESQIESQTESSSDSDDDSPTMSLREMLTLKLGDRELKGFVKQMPQVDPAEVKAEAEAEEAALALAQRNYKVHISRMTMAEINDSLQNPILRKELSPQLWDSDYSLIMDELGEIIGVERSSSGE